MLDSREEMSITLQMSRAVCVSPGRRPPSWPTGPSLCCVDQREDWFRNGLQVVPLPVQVQDSSHAHTPGTPLWSTLGMLCLALAGALLDGERERRLAATGLLILGLALAAWHAGSPPALDPTPPGRLGRGFLIGNGGLLLVGVGLVCGAVLRAPRARLRVGVRLLGALGTLLLAPVIISFLRAGGPLAALACALALWTAGAAIVIVARASARSIARRLASPPLTPDFRSTAGPRHIALIAIAGIVATLAGPHVV